MKFWEALKALDEGQTVQFKPKQLSWEHSRILTDFSDLGQINTMRSFDFRLKPKTVEVFVNEYAYTGDQRFGPVYTSEERCKNSRDDVGYIRTIRLREVIE